MIHESPPDRLSSKMSTPNTPPLLVGGHAPQFQLLFWLVGLLVNISKSYTEDLLAGRGNQNSQKHASKVSNVAWVESLNQQKKMQHALRVAVSNKAGSGKVSGSYVQHTTTSGSGAVMYSTPAPVQWGRSGLQCPALAGSSHIKTLAQGSAGLHLPKKASIHCICFCCFPGTSLVISMFGIKLILVGIITWKLVIALYGTKRPVTQTKVFPSFLS